MFTQLKKIYKSNEERLFELKQKTVPQELSDTWRSPLNNQQPWYQKTPKQYTEVEHVQQQMIFKENYHKKLPFMSDALLVLKKIMEQEDDK